MKFQRIAGWFSRTGAATKSDLPPASVPVDGSAKELGDLKSRGNSLLGSGKLMEAIECYQQVVALTPQDAGAHIALGFGHFEANHLEAAQQSFLDALAIDAQQVDAHFLLGQLLVRQNLPKQALQRFTTALALKPDFDFAWFELARLHVGLADLEAALQAYSKALAINPEFEDAAINKVNLLLRLERWQAVLDEVVSSRSYSEDHPLHVYEALALERLKRNDEGLLVIDKVLSHKPDYAEALQVKGTILVSMGKSALALPVYLRAIELNPNFACAMSDAGAIYAKNGDHDQALALYSRAIQAQPDHPDALFNYCVAFLHLGRCKEAIAMADKGLAYHPRHADMHWVKGAALLRSGELEDGWKEYEWRFHAKLLGSVFFKPNCEQPAWHGQPIRGKTIWLQAEQGLGDTIQLLRYVPLLSAKGAKVLLSVQEPLIELCQQLREHCVLISPGEAIPHFDFYCPMFSLPLSFRTNLSNIPAVVPYLSSELNLQHAWEAKLGPRTAPRIGLVWSGNPAFQNDVKRSVPLAALLSQLPSNCRYVSLQKEVRAADRDALAQSAVFDASANLHTFADTAALIACMDLVISVDTSVAHLAGAMAKTVWIMLPYSPDWRWMMERNDSPWYPTARLYRQQNDLSWQSVLARIGLELSAIS
jgi:tetratricopeptide (TPR) repeat protein